MNRAQRVSHGFPALSLSSTPAILLLLFGITLAFYHRLWFPHLVLIKRDAFRFFLPLKQYVIERLSAGELPQWFPYEGLGRSLIGVAGIGIFHPFTAVYFFLPGSDAYRASVLVSCLLAALGAFVLGRTLQLSRAGSLVAGIAFALSGYVVSLSESVLYLYSICLLPLFCAALEQALGQRSAAWLVVPAVLWATVFLNGDLQTGYYYGLIALLWVGMRPQGSYVRTGLRLSVIVGLAALLSAAILGPAWMAYLGSDRAQPALFHEQALYWSTHPLRLLSIVVSPVGGDADPVEVSHLFFGSRPAGEFPIELWAESLYLGIPVVGLAFLGARCRRDLCILPVLGGLALLLSLGRFGGLYELFFHAVPFWSAFRYPEKLMGVVTFAAAILAGAGFDELRKGQVGQTPWLVVSAIFVCAWLVLRTDLFSAWTAAVYDAPVDIAREVTHSAARASLFGAVSALGVALVLLAIQMSWLRIELLLAMLLAIVAADLSRANLPAYHTAPVEAATFTPGLVEAVKKHSGESGPGRFRLNSMEETDFATRERLDQWLSTVGITSLMLRQSLDLEHNAQFQIESGKAYLPGYNAMFSSLEGEPFGLEATARYNVAYFVGRPVHFSDARFADAFVAGIADYDLVLVHNPVPVKPRAYLSRRPERADTPVALSTLLERPDFLSGEVDVIEAPGTSLPGPVEGGRVTIERYAPEEVQVQVNTPQAAVLVLLDTFDAGWEARLEDGSELAIKRANGLVRAVVVPAGSHLVTFTYETPLLKAGAGASLMGVVLCLGIVAHARWRRRGSQGRS